ncbi:transposase domain-containing protein (plasmid) [Komagataeibacter sucrofermentans]|uniref:transposase domain-containing protein n=1 Tax=Komagataeibacter sucrofermentans TaxID=1053551 RepID=UPI0039FCDDF0
MPLNEYYAASPLAGKPGCSPVPIGAASARPICIPSSSPQSSTSRSQAWLADVLARINDQPVSRLHELLPWNWKNTRHANHTQAA